MEALWTDQLGDPSAVAVVARLDDEAVGSVLIRRDPAFDEGQLAGLHVLPPSWGRTIGSSLPDARSGCRRGRGHRRAGLWVLAANRRARARYESRGWSLVTGVEADERASEVRYPRGLP